MFWTIVCESFGVFVGLALCEFGAKYEEVLVNGLKNIVAYARYNVVLGTKSDSVDAWSVAFG